MDRAFRCPAQRDIDLPSGVQDEFLPRLGRGGPAAIAEEYDVPRWDFVENGSRATLRLGNDDGSLGSITTYRAVGDGWEPVSAVAWVPTETPGVPTRNKLRLGTHGYSPYEPWMSPKY